MGITDKIKKICDRKKGSVMIIIVVILTFSALLILATVKLTNLKNAKNNPFYLANVNKTHGRFLCYKKPDGKLSSIYIHYSSDGTELKEVNDDVSDCSFVVPNEINEFKLMLVGGGAGGRNSIYATEQTELNAENSINITPYETVYFQDTRKYFGKDEIAMKDISDFAPVLNWLKDDFLENIVKNYNPYDNAGVAFSGGKCSVNAFGSEKPFSGQLISNGKLFNYMNIFFKNVFTCNIVKNSSGEYVLAGAVLDDNGNDMPERFDLEYCIQNNQNCNDESPCCKYLHGLKSEGEDALIEDDFSSSLRDNAFEYLYKTTNKDNFLTFVPVGNKDSIMLYFLKNSFKIQEGMPGEPGSVVSCSVPSLPVDANGKFTIAGNMIGAGGKGGVEPTAGGNTELPSINGCEPAYGGVIAGMQNEQVLNSLSQTSDITPVAGKIPSEKVPYTEFELNNLSAGYYDAAANQRYNATMPGASGSSGGIKLGNLSQNSLCNQGYVLSSSGVQLFPLLSVANCREATDNGSSSLIEATDGAGGAVIIAW